MFGPVIIFAGNQSTVFAQYNIIFTFASDGVTVSYTRSTGSETKFTFSIEGYS